MNYLQRILAASFTLLCAGQLCAADLAPPADDEYQVVEETVVSKGDFKGCNPQVGIPIGGKLFICTTFGNSPILYYPKAVVFMNNNGEYKVLINGTEYQGYFLEDKK